MIGTKYILDPTANISELSHQVLDTETFQNVLAKDHLATPAKSAESERVCSAGGDIITKNGTD